MTLTQDHAKKASVLPLADWSMEILPFVVNARNKILGRKSVAIVIPSYSIGCNEAIYSSFYTGIHSHRVNSNCVSSCSFVAPCVNCMYLAGTA